MTTKETIAYIRNQVSHFQQKGSDAISAERLQGLLDHLESDQPAREIGILFSAKKEEILAKYRVRADVQLELFKSVLASGQAALKSMFLINGGAAVAVLAVIGHLSTSQTAASESGRFALPLACFGLGLVLTTAASGFTYLAQRAYSLRSKGRKRGNRLNALIVLLSIASIIAFIIGGAFAYDSIQKTSARIQPVAP